MCPVPCSGATQPVALLLPDNLVELLEANNGKKLCPAQAPSYDIECSHSFLKLLCVPSGDSASPTPSACRVDALYCVLQEHIPWTKEHMSEYSGRLRLWPIPFKQQAAPSEATFPLEFWSLRN